MREQQFEDQAEEDFRRLDPALKKAGRSLVWQLGKSLQNAAAEWWPIPVIAIAATVVPVRNGPSRQGRAHGSWPAHGSHIRAPHLYGTLDLARPRGHFLDRTVC